MRIEDFARHGLVVPLFAAAACRPAAKDHASLDLGDDLADVGFGESFHIEARTAGRGDVTWTQIAGLPLRDVVTSDGGLRFSARLSERAASGSEQMPWGIVPFSPRTRGDVVLAAEWHPRWGAEPVRRSVRVAAAARSRGLPNVPLGERLYLGGAGWHLIAAPANASAKVIELHGATTFTPDRSGVFTLADASASVLRVRAGRYDDTPLDCGRSGCHAEIAAAVERSPMTLSLAHLLERSDVGPEHAACALACHATGEPGVHDGGFVDVASDLGLASPLDDARDIRSLPRSLRRLGGVGCLACHGPSALPESAARWSILRADVCAFCHDAPPRYGHVAGWRASSMARADRDPEAATSSTCVGCHTTWGFLDRIGSAEHAGARRPPDGTGALGITCAACHDAHARGAAASPPHALARIVPVPEAFDAVPAEARARSGPCIACHAPDDSRDLARASAAAIWVGRGGLDTDTGAPLTGNAPHLGVPGGCVGCHATGPAGTEAGANHAFRVDGAKCAACHREPPKYDASSIQAEARGLWRRLIELGVVEVTGDANATRPGHATSRLARTSRPSLRRAAIDVSLLLEDPGALAHNLGYAKQLIEAARKAMGKVP